MRSATFVSILFFCASLGLAACTTYERPCEPNEQEPCTCESGEAGFQNCDEDGWGWGECECFCMPDCRGLDCGDNGCGGSCGNCPDCEGEHLENLCYEGACLKLCCPVTCESLGRICGDWDDGCGGSQSCGVCDGLHQCDEQGQCACKFQDCEGVCCEFDEICDQGSCVADNCCPAQNLYIWIRGSASDAITRQGVAVGIAVGAPLTFLAGEIDTHEAQSTTSMSGQFDIGCFDVSSVSIGLLLLADDPAFDGAAGNYFPTVSELASFYDNDEKTCMEDAQATVLTNQVVAGFQAALPSMDPAGVGFIVGRVLDSNLNPIAGATVQRVDGSALVVAYPNDSFTDFDGVDTAAHGTFVIPDEQVLTSLIGVRQGYYWESGMFAVVSIPGVGFWVDLVAN